MFVMAPAGLTQLNLNKRIAGNHHRFGPTQHRARYRMTSCMRWARALPARSEFEGMTSWQSGMMEKMDREMDAMQREMMQMDRMMSRDMYRMLDESRQLAEQARKQAEEMAKAGVPNVSIERSENFRTDRSSFRYYERVEIHDGFVRPYKLAPAQTVAGPSTLLIAVAAILTGAYAAVAAAFNRNFDLTMFKPEAKWKLLLLWPVLLIFSANFREQFTAAIQGRRAGKKDGE